MSTTSPPTSVAVLDSAVAWTHARLQPARDGALDLPTPCAAWDLGRLLTHMDDSLVALAEAAELGHVSVDALPRRTGGALVDRVEQRACRVREAWQQRLTSAPVVVGELTLGRDTLVLVGALEVAVHGWDVSQATGERATLPEDLAERLLDVATAVVTRAERGRRFSPQLMAPPTARAATRLLAHLGRRG